MRGRYFRHDAEPAERVDTLEVLADIGRDGFVAHAVLAVAAGDKIAIEPLRRPIFHIGDERLIAFDVVNGNLRRLEHGGWSRVTAASMRSFMISVWP